MAASASLNWQKPARITLALAATDGKKRHHHGGLSMKTVTVYTDGACSGNPGPGGWCAILRYGEIEKQLSGGEAKTTNNRMELTAVIEAGKHFSPSATHTTCSATGSRATRKTNTTTAATSRPFWRARGSNKQKNPVPFWYRIFYANQFQKSGITDGSPVYVPSLLESPFPLSSGLSSGS